MWIRVYWSNKRRSRTRRENRKEEQENEEDGRTQICIRVHVYIYMCGHTRRKGKIREEHGGKVQVTKR